MSDQVIHRTPTAPCCHKHLFSNAAVKLIFDASEGILLEADNICHESLPVGTSSKAASIDQDIVNWVVDQREIF